MKKNLAHNGNLLFSQNNYILYRTYTSPYPTDYQYLKFNYGSNTMRQNILKAISDRGYTAEENDDIITCKIPNSERWVSFGSLIKGNEGYGCTDWYLPYVTNTTGLFEWTCLTSIPDNFWGLSATQNLGRAFNCLQTQGGGLTEVKSFDGLLNVENFEYAFYQNQYYISFPTAFDSHTFEKNTTFYGCFQSVTSTTNMAPLAQHCNNVCPAGFNKQTGLASCPDYGDFASLGWS